MNESVSERFKISCFSSGVALDENAIRAITNDGRLPLTVHEYATTGGITFVLADGTYINAPFDEWWVQKPEVVLRADSGKFFADFLGAEVEIAKVLPLPGYIGTKDHEGREVDTVAMSHTDRVRLSPLTGCVFNCRFCDMADRRYLRHESERLLSALDVALGDDSLIAKHVLISGGSPAPAHYAYFEEVCTSIAQECELEVDIMMAAGTGDIEFIDRVVAAGIHGFSLNMELYGEVSGKSAPRYLANKVRFTKKWFGAWLERAVKVTGGGPRVRSLLLAGLEPIEMTLKGVEYIAERGGYPVLSPFRPAINTDLADRKSPSSDCLRRVLDEAREICARHGVTLAPHCSACQHNTLSFPWDAS